MKKFWEIFKDTNDYNEKTIVGAISFLVMVITIILDWVTDLEVKEFIYESFVTVTLWSFGIAEASKTIGNLDKFRNRFDK